MDELPAYQQRLLEAITRFWEQTKRPPTVHEMADELNVAISHITQTAKQLRDKGYLHKRRGLHLPESELYRPEEAAREIGVGRSTLNSWMAHGQVQTVRSPGGYHLIPLKEIKRIRQERHTPQFGVDFDLDPAWCNWLVGFTDGEGTFGIVENKKPASHYFSARYQLFQRADRQWILEEVLNNLRCGHIYKRHVITKPNGPGSYYVVNDHTSLTSIVIPFFDRYPPRMKHREYAVWRQATLLIVEGNQNFDQVSDLREELRHLYEYHE